MNKALLSAAMAAGMTPSFERNPRYPFGTALRDGKPILTPIPDDLAMFNAKYELAKVTAEQERIAKAKLRKARRELKRMLKPFVGSDPW